MNKILFKSRIDAGQQLALKLLPYKEKNSLILALPRGGVPIGYEIASKLGAPLDTIVARKIGAPFNPEFGLGAIAPGGVIILDNISIQSLGLHRIDLEPIIREELKEMERRIIRYKSGEYKRGKTADTLIIVDDGLATGVTARAAIESAKTAIKPKKIIFASSICAQDTAEHLRNLVDEVICIGEVNNLMAIGYWYEDFPQTTDEEVVELLEKAHKDYSAKN